MFLKTIPVGFAHFRGRVLPESGIKIGNFEIFPEGKQDQVGENH
jgi:hypothetical protein